REQYREDVGTIDVRVRHNNDSAVAQRRHVEATFVYSIRAIFFRFTDPRTDRRDHSLDLIVLEKLILARFLNVDEFSANRQNGLVTPVASLFGRAAGGIALHNIELGQFRITLRTIRQFAGQPAASERAFANSFPRL